MASPRVSASALKATRKIRPQHRELLSIFDGYKCSWCGCRFPESAVRKGTSEKMQSEKEFARHVCSECVQSST
jgi:hypothetical protein